VLTSFYEKKPKNMSRGIVVTSGKGGVGKSTVTANIGLALAFLGYNTLLVDADIGLHNLDLLLGLENRVTYTGIDVISERCKIEQAILTDKRDDKLKFFSLASNGFNKQITKKQFFDCLQPIKNDYDFILIDSPAGIDFGFQIAVELSYEAIVVVTPEVPSVRDADKVIGLLYSNGIKNITLLVNRVRPTMVATESMMSIADIEEILGIPLLGSIPDSEQVIIASNRGEPVVTKNSKTMAGSEFYQAARRLRGETVAHSHFDQYSPQNRVKRLFSKLNYF